MKKLYIIFLLIAIGFIAKAAAIEKLSFKYPVLAGDTISTVIDYYPPAVENDKNDIPLVIIGGSSYLMYGGSKDNVTMVAEYFAQLGYSTFNMNYHKGLIPLPLQDLAYKGTQSIAAGLKDIIHKAEEFDIDPRKLTLFGISAGGISSLMISTLDEESNEIFGVSDLEDKYGSLFGNSPYIGIDLNPAAVITLGAALADVNQIDVSDTKNCKYFLIHGEHDKIVAPERDLPFTDIGKLVNDGLSGLEGLIKQVESRHPAIEGASSLFGLNNWINNAKLKEIDGSFLVAEKLRSIDSTSVKTMFLPGEDHTILFGEKRRVPSARFKKILNDVDDFIYESTKSLSVFTTFKNRASKIILSRKKAVVGGGVTFMVLLILLIKGIF